MISNLQGAAEDTLENSIQQKINRVLILQQELKLPNTLVLKIKRQLDFSYRELKHHQLVHNSDYIDNLPSSLKAHFLLCVYANILNKVPFF